MITLTIHTHTKKKRKEKRTIILEIKFQHLGKQTLKYLLFGKNGTKKPRDMKTQPFGRTMTKNLFKA